MTNPKRPIPSFFKVLIGDFTTRLCLPPAFVKRFDESSSLDGKSITIRSPTEKYWAVKVEVNDNKLCFTSGWQNFVNHHSLETGDFLVFKYKGKSEFTVKIFGKSACEKNIVLPKMNNGGRAQTPESKTENCRDDSGARKGQVTDEEDIKPETMSSSQFKSENPCFITTYNESKLNYLTIPRKLALDNGLFKRKRIELVDPSENSWTIKLFARNEPDGRLIMTKGLSDFWRANQIAKGDTLIFELTRPSVFLVHAFRGEGNTPIKARIFEVAGANRGR